MYDVKFVVAQISMNAEWKQIYYIELSELKEGNHLMKSDLICYGEAIYSLLGHKNLQVPG
jgi:hypothetical protein